MRFRRIAFVGDDTRTRRNHFVIRDFGKLFFGFAHFDARSQRSTVETFAGTHEGGDAEVVQEIGEVAKSSWQRVRAFTQQVEIRRVLKDSAACRSICAARRLGSSLRGSVSDAARRLEKATLDPSKLT